MTAVAIFEGPRGVGKTTIINTIVNGVYFDPIVTFKSTRGDEPILDMFKSVWQFHQMQESDKNLVILVDRFHLTEMVMRAAENPYAWTNQLTYAEVIQATIVKLLQNPIIFILTVDEAVRQSRTEARDDGRGDEPPEVMATWERATNRFYNTSPCVVKVDANSGIGNVTHNIVTTLRTVQGGRNANSLAHLGTGSH